MNLFFSVCLASDFCIGQTLTDDVRGDMLETKSIMGQFSEIVPKHLLIQIPEQMERLHADIGSLDCQNSTRNALLSQVYYCQENILRGESITARLARQTHCKRGHQFTPANTLLTGIHKHRGCRTCRNLYRTLAKAERREQA